MGTKEYRKPEWVTHMEELQEALKGKRADVSVCKLHESVMSLNINNSQLQKSSTDVQQLQNKFTKASLIDNSFCAYDFIHDKNQVHGQIINETTMISRRHSFSSLLEFRTVQTFSIVPKYHSSPNLNEQNNFLQTKDEDCKYFTSFVLSPIEEYSETSSEANTSIKSKELLKGMCYKCRLSSCSWDFLSTKTVSTAKYTVEKFQTFPRSKADLSLYNSVYSTYNLDETHKFPLTPREIDPFIYYQLHTADSEEDLHEFLLLESACMNENKGAGLAAAFFPTKDN